MATIYTDIDTRKVLAKRWDAAIAHLKTIKGNSDSAAFVSAMKSCDFYRDAYEAACRKWRENDMVLIDGEKFINSGGNTALAAKGDANV